MRTTNFYFKGILVFIIYTTVYVNRKGYLGLDFGSLENGEELKLNLIFWQAIGYFASKLVGIYLIPSLLFFRSSASLFLVFFVSIFSLYGLSFDNDYIRYTSMCVNGLSLGLVWGILSSKIEGRDSSEIMYAFLCSSLIFGSSSAKSMTIFISKNYFLSSIFYTPLIASIMVVPLFVLAALIFYKNFTRNSLEVARRNARPLMNTKMKIDFAKSNTKLLVPLVIGYASITVVRDLRDYFTVELLGDVIDKIPSSYLLLFEVPTAIVLLVLIGSMYRSINHKRVVKVLLLLIMISSSLLTFSTLVNIYVGFSSVMYYIFSGILLYSVYLPFNGFLLERIQALPSQIGNAQFSMYIFDAIGYFSSVIFIAYPLIFFRGETLNIQSIKLLISLCSIVSLIAFAISSVKFERD